MQTTSFISGCDWWQLGALLLPDPVLSPHKHALFCVSNNSPDSNPECLFTTQFTFSIKVKRK